MSSSYRSLLTGEAVARYGERRHGQAAAANPKASCRKILRSATTADTPSLVVHYDGCGLPDTFRDLPGYDMLLTVQGERCHKCHAFQATEAVAKCAGKDQVAAYAAAPPAPPTPLCARGAEL